MSTARFNTLQNAAGTKSVPVETVVDGSAKAWVNFSGSGTVSIRSSFNVSSITDNGIGDYSVNFTNAMADGNYAAVTALGDTGAVAGTTGVRSTYSKSHGTTSMRFICTSPATDFDQFSVAIFR